MFAFEPFALTGPVPSAGCVRLSIRSTSPCFPAALTPFQARRVAFFPSFFPPCLPGGCEPVSMCPAQAVGSRLRRSSQSSTLVALSAWWFDTMTWPCECSFRFAAFVLFEASRAGCSKLTRSNPWLPSGWHLSFLIRGSTVGLFWGGPGRPVSVISGRFCGVRGGSGWN